MSRLPFNVNGKTYDLDVAPGKPLLYALREDLALRGPRFGCGLGQCGACTVLLDNNPVRSCLIPAHKAVGRAIVTLEGIGTLDAPHPLQRAFIEEQAAQCGYCISGMIMAAKALLDREPRPDDATIRAALAHNLCGCGTHLRIIRAIKRAARETA